VRKERAISQYQPATDRANGGYVVVLALYLDGLHCHSISLPILVLCFSDPNAINQPLLLISLACGGGVLPEYKAYQELGYKRSDARRQYHVSTWWQMQCKQYP